MSVPNLTTTEADVAMQYAYDTIRNDATLQALSPAPTVSAEWVEENTAFPRILVEVPSSAPDFNSIQEGYSRVMSYPRLQITVWSGNRSTDLIKQIAARITALLDGVGTVDVTGGQIVSIKRDWLLASSDVVQSRIIPKRVMQFSAEVTLTTA